MGSVVLYQFRNKTNTTTRLFHLSIFHLCLCQSDGWVQSKNQIFSRTKVNGTLSKQHVYTVKSVGVTFQCFKNHVMLDLLIHRITTTITGNNV